MDASRFQEELAARGIELSAEQRAQFAAYYRLLVEWNEKMNLTAITDEPGVYLKHFYDSITPAFYFDFQSVCSLCDVGAGAGFPSIPLKICFPHLEVTIVDSLNKRILFLEELQGALGLSGVRFVHARAEEYGQQPAARESYDAVTARAVARLSVLAELCVPLVKPGGSFLALKAAAIQEELQDAQGALEKLGAELSQSWAFELPEEGSARSICRFEKVRSTPKRYPRKPGIPNRSPLL